MIDFVLQGDNGIGIQGIQGPRGEPGEKVKETAFWKYNLKSIIIKMWKHWEEIHLVFECLHCREISA